MHNNYWVVVFPAVTIAAILLFYSYYLKAAGPLRGTTEWITQRERDTLSLSGRRHRLYRDDALPILLITVVYGVIAFLILGSHNAPESFYHFDKAGDSVTIELAEEAPADGIEIMYYPGLVHSYYTLELSGDGVVWDEQTPAEGKDYAMPQSYANLFKWQYANISSEGPVKFLRITAQESGMELGELAIYSNGELLEAGDIAFSPDELVDERAVVPDEPSWFNSMIFDEIYHGRAALEFLRQDWPYEATHPPLGKIIIAAGVAMFGMNPFGWRFMGTLFGVAMLPLLYILLKWLFGKKTVAVCGTLLFAFDFMHYVQTRIATIDTYSVFFTILMYMFMYRFITEDYDAPLKKSLPSLFLSGLFFGIGAASKWTALYAGAGLAVIYAVHHVLVWLHYARGGRGLEYAKRLGATVLLSIAFFVIIPAVIYYASYIPYGLSRGMTVGSGMLWSADYAQLVWANQVSMLSYHGRLTATHPYQSAWWQWLLNIRPILYYQNAQLNGGLYKSAIVAFGNPLVWWGGLGAIAALVWRAVTRKDGRALFILIGYFAALLPWVFISRCAFVYHYFPCSLFLCVALAHVFDTILERGGRRSRTLVCGYTVCALLLFAAFYPVLSGVAVPRWYTTNFLRWLFLSWPI